MVRCRRRRMCNRRHRWIEGSGCRRGAPGGVIVECAKDSLAVEGLGGGVRLWHERARRAGEVCHGKVGVLLGYGWGMETGKAWSQITHPWPIP